MSPENLNFKQECINGNIPFVEFDFSLQEPEKNPNYTPPEILDNKEWLKDLYLNMLQCHVKDDDSGLLFWIKELESNKKTRDSIYQYFRHVAFNDNQKNNKIDFRNLFDKTGRKRALFVIRQSLGDCFMITSLFESFNKQYPDYDLYVGTEAKYFDVFNGNEYVYKLLPYNKIMESELAMIGCGNSTGCVDVYFNPAICSQQHLNYLSINNIAHNLT